MLTTLPHVASVDAFQRWIYTSGEGHDADARDRAWLRSNVADAGPVPGEWKGKFR